MTANTIMTQTYDSPFTYTYTVTGLKVKDEDGNINGVVQTDWK